MNSVFQKIITFIQGKIRKAIEIKYYYSLAFFYKETMYSSLSPEQFSEVLNVYIFKIYDEKEKQNSVEKIKERLAEHYVGSTTQEYFKILKNGILNIKWLRFLGLITEGKMEQEKENTTISLTYRHSWVYYGLLFLFFLWFFVQFFLAIFSDFELGISIVKAMLFFYVILQFFFQVDLFSRRRQMKELTALYIEEEAQEPIESNFIEE